ncbi:hypothetical protein CQW23_04223 [Capsicum baccatum]|uniref:Leucine-rich repeat-containing N-terminal plant-type domain-containing protein n=1 Tax=Capsicum baccatum TaxID=33114 RepID=A0A2G2XE31_CAPBA|nr:hypothetical protein CQW23_04223 [Capsicum baccatum]
MTKWNSSTSLMSLYLSSVKFNGTIPESMSYLTSLHDLDMSSGNLSGPILKPLWNLTDIENLSLENNNLEGTIYPFFKFGNLRGLRIWGNNFTGLIPSNISSTICNLKTLIVLDLGSNKLNGTIPQCLGEIIRHVLVLDLSNNRLSGTIKTTFSIGNQLSVIKLHGNKLEGKVPRYLINCKYLELLDLGGNELNDTFPKWIGTLPNLKLLSLRSNKLHGPIKASKNKKLFAQLQIMDLSSNGFSGNLPARLFENFQAMKIIDENVRDPWNRFEGYIPSIIGDLAALHTLNLSHNRLEGRIPPSLHQLSVLESLDLSFNKIGRGIPQQLAFLTSLEVLNLSHNHLVGCISKGKQFDTFELHEEEEEKEDSPMISWQAVLMGYGCGFINNAKAQEEILVSPPALPHLCSEDQALALLQFKHMFTINPNVSCFNPTSLSWNKSTDCCSWDGVRCDETTGQVIELYLSCSGLQGKFHPNNSLFQLSNLERLDLSYNDFSGYLISPKFGAQLRGVLRKSVFHLFNLEDLYLPSNSLTGPIPSNVSGLQSLQSLAFGKIASTVCNLKILVVLDLGSNYLNGTIPQCLGEMSGLQVLDLNKNSLIGTINTSFNTESQLRIINLYGNKLKGKVPPSLINCRYLEFLDLGNNDLNDTFPSWMGGHPYLKILSLRSNKLHSHISDSRTDNLFDQIQWNPRVYSRWLFWFLREYFDSYNKGTGSEISSSFDYIHDYLPSIIGDLVGLRALNLSHNGLESAISTSLQYLSVLESLDLSSNKIGGEITQQLVSITSLEVLNLSHNHLVGCIHKGKQFDAFENSSHQYCGGEDGVPQVKTPVELDEEEKEI